MSNYRKIFGREIEIRNLLQDVNSNQKTVTVVEGEPGVGKSALLEVFYNTVKRDYGDSCYIGYYDNINSLISESISYTYPISICLGTIFQNILDQEKSTENDNGKSKLENVLRNFLREDGTQLVSAILEDLAKKVGLDKTTTFLKRLGTGLMHGSNVISVGSEVLSNQKEEIFWIYLKIFKLLAKEFPDKKFVLIFDQIENVGKNAIDLLLNIVKLSSDNFHFIISYKTEERRWQQPEYKTQHQYFRDNIIFELKGKELKIVGISAEAIGDWILSRRKRRLPLVPDLVRIRENCAGLPILLEQWIENSETLDPVEIDINKHCEQLNRLLNGLTNEDIVLVRKLSILLDPVDFNFMIPYLGIKSEEYDLFIDRISEQGIFDRNNKWFKHDLIKKCIESNISDEIKRGYQTELSLNCERYALYPDQKDYDQITFKVHTHYAYILHQLGDHEKSFFQNKNLGGIAQLAGYLDLAERSYRRALIDGTKLDEKSEEIADCYRKLGEVYVTWGKLNEAMENYKTSLDYYSATNNDSKISSVLDSMGIIYDHLGEHKLAMEKYEEALKIARRLNDEVMLVSILTNIGVIYDKERHFQEALDKYNEAVTISKKLGDKESTANLLNNIGVVMGTIRRTPEGLVKLEEGLKIADELNYKRLRATIIANMGIIYDINGEHDQALKKLEEALQIYRKLGDERNIAGNITNIGLIHARKGNKKEALSKYEEALGIVFKLNDKYHMDLILRNIANLTLSADTD